MIDLRMVGLRTVKVVPLRLSGRDRGNPKNPSTSMSNSYEELNENNPHSHLCRHLRDVYRI